MMNIEVQRQTTLVITGKEEEASITKKVSHPPPPAHNPHPKEREGKDC